jgi:hypothetical protein
LTTAWLQQHRATSFPRVSPLGLLHRSGREAAIFSPETRDGDIMMAFAGEGGDLDDDEPDAWPDIPQQKLDESMRCAICQEIFTMPVSFGTCTHTCTPAAGSYPSYRIPTRERPPKRASATSDPFTPPFRRRRLLVVHQAHAEGV